MFTDECGFRLLSSKKQYARRPRGMAYDVEFLSPTLKFQGGTPSNVWGCVSGAGTSYLR